MSFREYLIKKYSTYSTADLKHMHALIKTAVNVICTTAEEHIEKRDNMQRLQVICEILAERELLEAR